tara:strand:+ start:2008 stop:2460 length:453 start_codon:yes stop_codon:yes gene_type:complete
MELAMTRYRLIRLYLGQIIFDNSINHKIIKYLSDMESYDYHINRYNTISNLYKKNNKNYWNKSNRLNISFVLNSETYVSKPDVNLDFYNETGQSYQVRNLLLSLISIPVDNSDFIHFTTILSDEIKEWRSFDDIMYGKLSKKIMNKMVQN